MPHWYEFHTEIHCEKSLGRIGLTHQFLPACNLDLIADDMCHVVFDMAMCIPNVNSDHLDLEQRHEFLLFNPDEKSLQDPEKESSEIRTLFNTRLSCQMDQNGHNSHHNCPWHTKKGSKRDQIVEKERESVKGSQKGLKHT